MTRFFRVNTEEEYLRYLREGKISEQSICFVKQTGSMFVGGIKYVRDGGTEVVVDRQVVIDFIQEL